MNKKLYISQSTGSRSMRAKWAPDWLESAPPDQVVQQPSPLPAQESDDVDDESPSENLDFADYSEWCWSQITTVDHRYLTGARDYPSPCPWCGGRLSHNRLCDELRRSWEPSLPFGKHKGKPLSAVPRDYLEWFAGIENLDSELRAAIDQRLEREEES